MLLNHRFYDFLEEKVIVAEDENKKLYAILELEGEIKELFSMSKSEKELFTQKLDSYKDCYFFEIEVWDKKDIYTQKQILNFIYSTALVLDRVKEKKESIEIETLEDNIKEEIKQNRIFFEFIFKNNFKSLPPPPSVEIKSVEIKDVLLKEGLIDTDFFLKPNKTIEDVKRALKKYVKTIFFKTNCPICGHEFIKNNKSKTTCGHHNCKKLKSRFKEKMKPFVKLSKEDFYKKLVEVDKKRLETNKRKGSNAQKIANLPQLAEILYNELIG